MSLASPYTGSMSTPAHRPKPRTDSTPSGIKPRRRRCRCMPNSVERRWNSPVASRATTVDPTAVANGLPPNVEPCSPGSQDAQYAAVGNHRRQRHHPAAQCLAEQVDVGHDTPVLTRESAPGAREARLDLVGDHQHVVLAAQCPHRGQVVIRRHDDAGLALDRFEQHRHRVVIDGAGERGGVPERDRPEAGSERAEAAAGSRIRREADNGDCAAVKVVVCHHDSSHGPAPRP